MSHKAFYQTFFQTEQLFRRADDGLVFPALGEASPAQTPPLPTAVAQPAPLPPVIVDPVLPTTPPPAAPDQPEPHKADDLLNVPVAPTLPAPATGPVPRPVEPPGSGSPAPRRPAAPLLGQKVLILVDEELLPSDLLFLEKILKAVNLDVAGVDLLNIHGTKHINFAEVLAGKTIHHFFTFGVPFTRLDLDILMDRYHPVRFDGITFLLADALPAIEADVVLKKRLWEALKKIFLWR